MDHPETYGKTLSRRIILHRTWLSDSSSRCGCLAPLQPADYNDGSKGYKLLPAANTMTENLSSELTRHVAVVTGSSSGIGRAIALELATAGAMCLFMAHTIA